MSDEKLVASFPLLRADLIAVLARVCKQLETASFARGSGDAKDFERNQNFLCGATRRCRNLCGLKPFSLGALETNDNLWKAKC